MCLTPQAPGGPGSFDGNNGGTFGGPAPAPSTAAPQAAPTSPPAPSTFNSQPMLGAQPPAFQSAVQQPAAPPSNVSGTFSQFGPRPGGSGRVVN